jgi:hypothetical protein
MTTAAEAAARQTFEALAPGDRVEVIHEVKVGLKVWSTKTIGVVESKERRRQGLHFRRHTDDKVFADMLVLRRDDGELTTVTMDEFTQLRKL